MKFDKLPRHAFLLAALVPLIMVKSCSESASLPICKDGWDIYVAGSYRYGPSLIVNENGSIDAWFSATGGIHGRDKIHCNWTDEEHNATYRLADGDAAQYFKCETDFYSIHLCCANWGSQDESLTLNVYTWKGDYKTSVSSKPVCSKKFTGYDDNAYLEICLSEEAREDHSIKFPAGEYLWVACNPSEKASVWMDKGGSASTGGLSPKSFKDGHADEGFQFKSRILTDYTECQVFWDQITYQHSDDGGRTWTQESQTLSPTDDSWDLYSCCDPGVARWGGWYYIAYTSCENPRQTDDNVCVARSKSPDGPWEKWNGKGWGGKPHPIVMYSGVGNDEKYGAGEPCFVVLDETVYLYYTWKDEANQTRVCTAPSDEENWPAHLTYRGIAIDKTTEGADHSDVKYRTDEGLFYAINTAKRFTDEAYIQIWTSRDGLKFTLEGKMEGTGFRKGLHNCGWSGDELGHQDPSKPQFISYAYGTGSWGVWNTWLAPLEFPTK